MNFSKNRLSKKTDRKQQQRNKPNKNKRAKEISTIDTRLFSKKAIPLTEVTYQSIRSIRDLPVDARIINNLIAKGYTRPTEIQDKSLEPLLDKRNLLGIAQTGTGKTGAFLIPVLNNLIGQKPAFQILIVVPTRELAIQVQQELTTIVKGLSLRSLCFIGGTSVSKDIVALSQPTHVVIGTPGRLTDLARQGALPFTKFNTLILDEFDRLLDMGFIHDIQFMVQAMINRKQTILFSATEEKDQANLINKLLEQPVTVRISKGKITGDHIDQEVVRIEAGETKLQVLLRMVQDESFKKVIVFAETKRNVSTVRKKLHQSGIRVDEIHGNKSQNYRLKALNDFKSGKIQVLIATDVAARGLDISEVTHVINFQPPRDFDSYIHRIGRTGRAGRTGKAFTFIN
jgi:ATP-dependent RNA helicase RhlE